MTIDKVVDASALAAIAFLEPRAAAMAARLSGHGLLAPALLHFEMAQVCIKKLRQYPLRRAELLAQYESYLKIHIHAVAIDFRSVVNLAERSGLTAYDASYLWLAQRLGIELVTADATLEKAFARAPRSP